MSGEDRSPCALNWYEGRVLVKARVLGWVFSESFFPTCLEPQTACPARSLRLQGKFRHKQQPQYYSDSSILEWSCSGWSTVEMLSISVTEKLQARIGCWGQSSGSAKTNVRQSPLYT